MSAPVTPSSPEAAVAFVKERYGASLAEMLTASRPARLGTARQRRITELRRCGELRHAERYGWLSLAGWLLGMKIGEVSGLDPTSAALSVRSGAGDVLPEHLGDDPAPVLTTILDTGLDVSDPRDPYGFAVVELLATALNDGVVEVGGRQLGAGIVANSLRDRLKETVDG